MRPEEKGHDTMAYSMPPAEVLGTVAGYFAGEWTKEWGKSAGESIVGSGETGRGLGAALGAAFGHYVGASVTKGVVNMAMGDLLGLAMNTMVTSPTTAALHGIWALFEKPKKNEAPAQSGASAEASL